MIISKRNDSNAIKSDGKYLSICMMSNFLCNYRKSAQFKFNLLAELQFSRNIFFVEISFRLIIYISADFKNIYIFS